MYSTGSFFRTPFTVLSIRVQQARSLAERVGTVTLPLRPSLLIKRIVCSCFISHEKGWDLDLFTRPVEIEVR